jgi:hypothetical protein
MNPRAAQVRIYVDADLLGLGKILAGLRNDVTYPADARVHASRRRVPMSADPREGCACVCVTALTGCRHQE